MDRTTDAMVLDSGHDGRSYRCLSGGQALTGCWKRRHILRPFPGRTFMTWKTPRIIEITVGLEINSYVCADL
jgi:coenzyme PQQ precursor peptide PqqA